MTEWLDAFEGKDANTWSKHPPRQPCYAIFRGLRVTKSGRVSEMYEPVQISYTWRGRQKELAVSLCGRQQRIPLTAFSGDWQIIDLEEVTV